MRFSIIGRIGLILLVLSVSACKKEEVVPTPQPTVTVDKTQYTDTTFGGFHVKIKTYLKKTPDAVAALQLMKHDLEQIDTLVPKKALDIMQAHPVWMEREIKSDGAAWYHTNLDWLKSQGYNTDKWHCVEINNYVNYVSWTKQNQPYMVLHELSHLYHDLAFTFDDPGILAAYNNAVSKGLYQGTDYYDGTRTYKISKAYALTNQMEYFSELSEAYWGKNDYFPFDYDQLKQYDTLGFATMEKCWGPRTK